MNWIFERSLARVALIAISCAAVTCAVPETRETGGLDEPEPVGHADQAAISIPSGFTLLNSWTVPCSTGTCNAVRVYKKIWAGGQPDYVTVMDLRYANLASVTGAESGAPCATFGRNKVDSTSTGFWSVAKINETSTSKLRAVVNGTFFSSVPTPTSLAFGLKRSGTVRSYGYGTNSNGVCGSTFEQGQSNTLIFAFNMPAKSAWIGPWSKSTFDNATPDEVGALGPLCCKAPTTYDRRTVVGIRDDNADGVYETVFFFSSTYAKLSGTDGADDTLAKFGATVRAQLDGGSSTGLVVNGTAHITSGRTVPHALAVYSP